jgi:hypothetical protein
MSYSSLGFFTVILLFLNACNSRSVSDTPSYSYTPPPVIPEPITPVIEPITKTLVQGKDFLVRDISVSMSQIDDIGLVFVRHDDGSLVLA